MYHNHKAFSKLLKFGNKEQKGCNQGVYYQVSKLHTRKCASSIRNGKCFNETWYFTRYFSRRKPTKLNNFRKEMISLADNNTNNNNNPKSSTQQSTLSNIQGLCPQRRPSSVWYIKDLMNYSKHLFLGLTDT